MGRLVKQGNGLRACWSASALALAVAGMGCGASDAANNNGGTSGSTVGAPVGTTTPGGVVSPGGVASVAGAMPCDVNTVVKSRCQMCHGATPIGGAPISLVTLAGLPADVHGPNHAAARGPDDEGLPARAHPHQRLDGHAEDAAGRPLAAADFTRSTAGSTRARLRARRAQAARAPCSTMPGGGGHERRPAAQAPVARWIPPGGRHGTARTRRHPQDATSIGTANVHADHAPTSATTDPTPVPAARRAARARLVTSSRRTASRRRRHDEVHVPTGESYNQFYFADPVAERTRVATRFGARFDNLKVLHHWLGFCGGLARPSRRAPSRPTSPAPRSAKARS